MTATTKPAKPVARKPNLLGRYGPIGIAAVLAAALMTSPAAAAWPLIGGVHATPSSDAAVRLAPPTVEVTSALSGASTFVGLAPQPEPPSAGVRMLDPADLVGLNPQPEPPSVLRSELWRNPFALLGLDPRPEPPSAGARLIDPADLVGLNPQPEPPSRPVFRMEMFVGQ